MPLQYPVAKSLAALLSSSWNYPLPANAECGVNYATGNGTTVAGSSTQMLSWGRYSNCLLAGRSLQAQYDSSSDQFAMYQISAFGGSEGWFCRILQQGDRLVPPPSRAAIGEGGDLLSCSWWVRQTGTTFGLDGRRETWVWWLAASEQAGKALICLAPSSSLSSGYCARQDAAGNLDIVDPINAR